MPRKPRVFVVQEPLISRGVAGPEWRIDPKTLEVYGEIVCVFSWGELKNQRVLEDPALVDKLIAKAREKLQGFDDKDYLVPLGNPALIAIATLVAAQANTGFVTVLDWIRNEGRYRVVEIASGERLAVATTPR